MSRWIRVALAACVVMSARTETSGRGAEGASAGKDVVCLTTREPDRFDQKVTAPPFLARELIRQAFLLAARDECGLATRDKSLREEFPDGPRTVRFEMSCDCGMAMKTFEFRYALFRFDGAARTRLWDWTPRTDLFAPEMITTFAEAAEAYSRGPLKRALEQSGLGAAVPPARAKAEVPRAAEDALWSGNEIAVLGGLRRVHAEIREKGESPELLAALAVGYANLGLATSYHFSPAHKAHTARSLLYAERLMRKTNDAPWARWHRAYARALAGVHNLAIADLQAAKRQAAKEPAGRSPSGPTSSTSSAAVSCQRCSTRPRRIRAGGSWRSI